MNSSNNIESHFISLLKKYKIHFIAWFIFILYESVLAGMATGIFGKPGNYAVHYAINITLFYINAHLVLPHALKHPVQVIFRLPLFLALLIIAYVIFVFGIDSLLVRYTDFLEISDIKLEKLFWHRSIWRSSYFIGFSTGYYYLITYLKEKSRTSDLEKQRLFSEIANQKAESELIKTQNAFIKAQINPHFLFNTLTFMHSQTKELAPKVAQTILSLSQMMRYSLKNTNLEDLSELTEEIEQLQNLIKIHELRSDQKIHLLLKRDLSEIKIIPLVLITLAENMYKHGDLSDLSWPANIYIGLHDNDLIIKTVNKISTQKNETGLNLGLINIKNRLKYTYKEAFTFMHYTGNQNCYHTKILIENICRD